MQVYLLSSINGLDILLYQTFSASREDQNKYLELARDGRDFNRYSPTFKVPEP